MLPNETLHVIFSFLDRISLDRLEIVCRRFGSIVRRDFSTFPKDLQRSFSFNLYLFTNAKMYAIKINLYKGTYERGKFFHTSLDKLLLFLEGIKKEFFEFNIYISSMEQFDDTK